jgi:hypothetical protein
VFQITAQFPNGKCSRCGDARILVNRFQSEADCRKGKNY